MYKQTEIAAYIAYLIGVPIVQLNTLYNEEHTELFNALDRLDATYVIRTLCKFRTKLLRNFVKTDKALQKHRYFTTMTWFDIREIKKLETLGIVLYDYAVSSTDLLTYVNMRIADIVDNCQMYLPDTIIWDYIRNLFIYPNYNDTSVQKSEFEKYMQYHELYLYRLYVHWEPVDCGNWLTDDVSCLSVIYAQNEDDFDAYGMLVLDSEPILDKVIYALDGFNRLMRSI